MPKRPLIAGNWKMHKTVNESVDFVKLLVKRIIRKDIDILVAPPFLSIYNVSKCLKETSILVAGQDLFWEEKGAYTGEISAPMLKATGATHVILGHSERRQYFHENEKTVNLKIIAALKAGLVPIVCVGETLIERKLEKTKNILESQIIGSLAGIGSISRIIIAYEPVWAIGTGEKANNEQIYESHQIIKECLRYKFNKKVEKSTRILYGGSVNSSSVNQILNIENVGGALIGGASLNSEEFLKIIEVI